MRVEQTGSLQPEGVINFLQDGGRQLLMRVAEKFAEVVRELVVFFQVALICL